MEVHIRPVCQSERLYLELLESTSDIIRETLKTQQVIGKELRDYLMKTFEESIQTLVANVNVGNPLLETGDGEPPMTFAELVKFTQDKLRLDPQKTKNGLFAWEEKKKVDAPA